MKKRSFLNSPYLQESKKKKRNILKKKIAIYTSIFLVVFVGLGLLSRWQKLNIQTVVVPEDTITDRTAIEEVVNLKIAGEYLWLFPKSNFLIYPREKIKEELATQFKILRDISVNLKGLNTLEVSFSERQGAHLWCGNTPPETRDVGEACYFMDETGYIFGEAPYFSGDVYLKFFGKVVDGDLPMGFYFSQDIFEKLVSFRNNMEGLGLTASSMFIKDDGDGELYLSSNAPFPEKPKVIFKTEDDFENLTENLQAALTTEPLQTDFKKKYSQLEYIDLRFGNKVYYRFR